MTQIQDVCVINETMTHTYSKSSNIFRYIKLEIFVDSTINSNIHRYRSEKPQIVLNKRDEIVAEQIHCSNEPFSTKLNQNLSILGTGAIACYGS